MITHVLALFSKTAAVPRFGEIAHFLNKKSTLNCFQILREDTAGYTYSVMDFIYSHNILTGCLLREMY